MRHLAFAIPLALGVLRTGSASGQETQPQVPSTELKTDEGPIQDPNVPDPKVPRERVHPPEPPTHRYGKADYPDEIVKRPLTLPSEMAQFSLDVPLSANHGNPILTEILQIDVGITQSWQVGLTYGFGLERLDPDPGQEGYESGKAFSVDTAYTIIPQYLAAELSFAFFADPNLFGMALELGIPFKLEFADRWAFFGGQNLLRVKLHGLPVDPADPEYNFEQGFLLSRGARADDGRLDFNFGLAFQAQSNVAVFANARIGWPNFDSDDQPYSLFLGAEYTAAHRFDVGARIGFVMLDHLSDSFQANIFAALRI